MPADIVTLALISLATIAGFWISTQDPALGVLGMIGVLLYAIGLALETVADVQLARFKRDPAKHNQVMRSGVWRYSRHPNYFGEFMIWCGFFLIAFETPWGWLGIVSPLTLLWILLGPLGVGLVERRMRKKRPEAFADYAHCTSAFVPWFPKVEGDWK